LFGASVLSIEAVQVNSSTISSSSIDFCNVSINYTHPGQNDQIHVSLWLPKTWNGRLQGVGGGGWTTNAQLGDMVNAVSQGYAAVTTDGGHISTLNTSSWALLSPGNVNFYLLQDFASVSLNDMTIIGKQLTEAYYGTPISKTYWNGCSTGGRQGLMIAQRYPDAYDGILAGAPAINFAEFIPSEFWPQRVMHEMKYFPSQCEFDAITAAAVEACDELDGLRDGIIGLIGLCGFDPSSVVGQAYSCDNTTDHIMPQAAAIIQAIWDGPRDAEGRFQWYGLGPQAPLNGLANTTCSADGTCTGAPFSTTEDWFKIFLEKDLAFDPYNMTQAEWDATFHASINQYTSIMGTSDPDLTEFRHAGGKMITWHGMADQLIPFNGTVDYYERVLDVDPEAKEYYRFYAAPGVGHCGGLTGAAPTDAFAQLVRWVEEGEVPETLAANRTVEGRRWEQELCLWPLSSRYVGGDPSMSSSFRCE
jgi:pimeloyl-ACP methyl ester carboxylesterase